MTLDGTTLTFHTLGEAQVYIRAAKAVFTLLPPDSKEEGEKYTLGEWELLFKLALRMAEDDVEWANELVKSVVVPTVFMATLELTRTFDEDPKIFIVCEGEFHDAFYDEEEAKITMKIRRDDGSRMQAVSIASDHREIFGFDDED